MSLSYSDYLIYCTKLQCPVSLKNEGNTELFNVRKESFMEERILAPSSTMSSRVAANSLRLDKKHTRTKLRGCLLFQNRNRSFSFSCVQSSPSFAQKEPKPLFSFSVAFQPQKIIPSCLFSFPPRTPTIIPFRTMSVDKRLRLAVSGSLCAGKIVTTCTTWP